MKYVLIIIALFVQSNLFANKIDELKSDIEVQKFIRKQNHKFKDFEVVKLEKLFFGNSKKIADSLNIKTWQKVDFDNNGQTDLLVYGNCRHSSLIAIIAEGNKFKYYSLDRGYVNKIYFAKITVENSINTLVLTEYCEYFCKNEKFKTKNLIYKFGQFIEPNYSPKKYQIEKIEYSTTMCFGTCPIFNIEINLDRNAIYNAIQYNNEQGVFYTKIDTNNFSSIIDILNYIDFPSLKNNYNVDWTDDQSCTLIITYENGKKKTITDYGKIGTNGLIQVYNKMFALRKSQNWNKK